MVNTILCILEQQIWNTKNKTGVTATTPGGASRAGCCKFPGNLKGRPTHHRFSLSPLAASGVLSFRLVLSARAMAAAAAAPPLGGALFRLIDRTDLTLLKFDTEFD